jgi:hypothetical protein
MGNMPNAVNAGVDEFTRESLQIVSTANKKGIYLRILGSLSCYLRLKEHDWTASDLFLSLGRLPDQTTFTDLDLVGYKKQRIDVMRVLETELNLKPDQRFNAAFGGERLLYYKDNKFTVDIFFDKLQYSHDVDFRNRLELDYPTITVTDFVLEKLQIHEINRKDLIDLVVTFLYHRVGSGSDKRSIDADYISDLLSSDWGFWFDVTTNLEKTLQLCDVLLREGKLSSEQAGRSKSRISELLQIIEKTSKTDEWTKRAKVGTKKQWYRDVEEVVR